MTNQMEMKQLKMTTFTPVEKTLFPYIKEKSKGTAKRQQEMRAEADHARRRCKRCCIHVLLEGGQTIVVAIIGFGDVGEGVMARLFPTLRPLQPFRG